MNPPILMPGSKYVEINATGELVALPSQPSACLMLKVKDAEVYFTCQPSITLASCLVPVSSGDACSVCLADGAMFVFRRPASATHIAIKAVGAGTAKVVISPCEQGA